MRKLLISNKYKNQTGAVSLFVVVFAALLITVVVVSFVRIMVSDQQQASRADLSQSAYDSAQAGVEDGKRALLRYQNICDDSTKSNCDAVTAKINSDQCNVSLDSISKVVDNEVKIQQNIGDNALNQAYTCVKIQLQTDDYLGTLQTNGSIVVPLVSKTSFKTVRVEWYTADDLQSSTDANVDLLPPSTLAYPLLAQSSWPTNRPSIMRSQLMQVGSNFKLGDFNDTNNSSQSNANTLFLYPVGVKGIVAGSVDSKTFTARDLRKSPIGSPQPITCSGTLSNGGYACKADLVLPVPIGGGTRTAFLRLTSMYNRAHFRVSLSNGSTAAKFDGVQPEIDSTGRANELFRRVKSRVELRDVNFPYPDAAVDITGNLCKDFLVTDNTADYKNNCTP